MKYLKEGKGKDNIGNPDDNSAITLTEYSYTAAGRIKEIITKPMTASCHSDGWLSSGFKQEKLRNPQQPKIRIAKQQEDILKKPFGISRFGLSVVPPCRQCRNTLIHAIGQQNPRRTIDPR